MRSLSTLHILSASLHVFPIIAGPGAVVYGCVNLQVQPSASFNVTFEVNTNSGANKCMNSYGNSVTVEVSKSGATCGEVGYVEAKSSDGKHDLCASDESIWNLAYYTLDLPASKSGSVRSRWTKLTFSNTNEIIFKENEYIAGAMVCPTEALCSATQFYWRSGSTGPAYFIFQPDKQNSLADCGAYQMGSPHHACHHDRGYSAHSRYVEEKEL